MIKKSTKIWLAIAGILLIALGIVCLVYPTATLYSAAWFIGCFVLVSGIARLVFTFRTQAFLPNSGTRMLSSILQMALGIIFLSHNPIVTASLPVIFATWILVEGIIICVQSFDYKKAEYGQWWCILLLGILGAFFGIYGLSNPAAAGVTLSWMIGIGIISMGTSYLVALAGVNRLEKTVNKLLEGK